MSDTLIATSEKKVERAVLCGLAAACFACAVTPVGGKIELPDGLTFWRMPSTSRAYPLPLAQKAEAYRRLFAAQQAPASSSQAL